jgi:hypothetical protein
MHHLPMPQPTRTKGKPTGSGMVLTDRDRSLIAAVADLGIATREQLARHLRFGSTTRANAVLLRLFRHGYLARRLQPSLRGTRRLTYFVGPQGHELLGSFPRDTSSTGRRRWPVASDLFVDHQLDVNDVRLAFEHFECSGYEFVRFRSERELSQMNLNIVPDGYIEYRFNDKAYALFLEVDRGTETRSRWSTKVNAYLSLAHQGIFSERFGRRFFRVVTTAPTLRRLKGLSAEIAKKTDRIFWLSVRDDLLRLGPFARLWYRPNGDGPKSLTE